MGGLRERATSIGRSLMTLRRRETGAPYPTVPQGSGTARALETAMYMAFRYSAPGDAPEGWRGVYTTYGPNWRDLRRYAKTKGFYYSSGEVSLKVGEKEKPLLDMGCLKELRILAEESDEGIDPRIKVAGTVSRSAKIDDRVQHLEQKSYEAAIALIDSRLLDEMLSFIGWADNNGVRRHGDVEHATLRAAFNSSILRQGVI